MKALDPHVYPVFDVSNLKSSNFICFSILNTRENEVTEGGFTSLYLSKSMVRNTTKLREDEKTALGLQVYSC